MAKKIVIGAAFSLLLTWVFWRLTGVLPLGRTGDNIAFAVSPILAIIISVLLVRSELMTSNQTDED
ncbi:hypothetical protein ACHMW7_20430 [Aminobacter sp. UC22_36]|uniref:hypothetical protein n=1 Tax=Aminobacter sp. UC22_36 TaxID=3374549 RepID=UPI0037571B75